MNIIAMVDNEEYHVIGLSQTGLLFRDQQGYHVHNDLHCVQDLIIEGQPDNDDEQELIELTHYMFIDHYDNMLQKPVFDSVNLHHTNQILRKLNLFQLTPCTNPQ